ncbi:MAG TPA: hypothetical protein VGE07_30380 [Herpetosiphonaceae bacterium]
MDRSIGRTLRALLLLALLAACGAPAATPATHTYTIAYTLLPDDSKVTVTAEIPGTWTETLDPTGGPSFTVPGNSSQFLIPTIVALHVGDGDDATRLERAMELQYGKGMPDVVSTPLGDGRIWAVRKETGMIHARMFIPAPDGVVMAVSMLKPEDEKLLPEIEAVYRTVRVSP